MKKFLKKYGYILLVVVIAAGCYTGFRAFRYYYHCLLYTSDAADE